MNPVTAAVMNLTGSFLEVFRSFGTVLRADSVRPIRPAADILSPAVQFRHEPYVSAPASKLLYSYALRVVCESGAGIAQSVHV